jgi:CheY-like chemotaxis protein
MEPTRLTAERPTVLVVDDSPAMLRYLKLLLESDSYQVETAGNGEEALLRLRQGCAPAVVLLDLQMPGMDGLKTLRQLRKLRPSLRVIICSGVDDPRQARRASLMGAYSYLTKPVQHLYLSAALERCLREVSGVDAEAGALGNLVTLPAARWH